MALSLVEDPSAAGWLAGIDVLSRPVRNLFPVAFDAYTEVRHPDHEGTASLDILTNLTNELQEHTGTPQSVYFCAWEGWGDIKYRDTTTSWMPLNRGWTNMSQKLFMWFDSQRGRPEPAPVQIPNRGYYLLHGHVMDASDSHARSFKGPSMWWPEDRAWFVATEVDALATYVGSSAETQETLLTLPESSPVEANDEWLIAGG